jgi:hypothetical protein
MRVRDRRELAAARNGAVQQQRSARTTTRASECSVMYLHASGPLVV